MISLSNKDKEKLEVMSDTDEHPMLNKDYEVELSDDEQPHFPTQEVVMPHSVLDHLNLLWL